MTIKTNNLRALIVEDEEKAGHALQLMLKQFFPELTVDVSRSVPEAVLAYNKKKPDIIFLDIEMPVYSGFQLFEFIPDLDASVIFTTAYDQYAVKAISVSALDYLLKPIEAEELNRAVKKAMKKAEEKVLLQKIRTLEHNYTSGAIHQIALPSSEQIRFVEVQHIQLIEADGIYSHVHLSEGPPLIVSKNIRHFEDALAGNDNFFRIHRKHIINLNFIRLYRKGESLVLMKSGASVNVSRDRKAEFKQAILKYKIGDQG